MTDIKVEEKAMAKMKEFINQGYTMVENARVLLTTEIDFDSLEIDIDEEFISVEEVINECMTDELLDKVYKQEPTYMIFRNNLTVKHCVTYEELIEFIANI
ncbi:hypothetical protein [Mammaliicoccus sciuri]|uniref:hypothetical protein n=1 Tax=Mammaliicoccus sciuri TaxID=1296 RepID=UPI001FB2A886|nr:hypothetical protein [Mammaliicoccus sciuri]MCJ0941546.1 hypothetical protein [Mammaliicoccus sciuri]